MAKKRLKPFKSFFVRETIVVTQEIITSSKKDAERIYKDMMKDNNTRADLTRGGATSSSTTEADLEVLNLEEYEEKEYGEEG